MAEAIMPPKAKLFIGILSGDEALLLSAHEILAKKFGEIDYQTKKIPFAHTSYYKSIGANLNKVFYSFARLIRREEIAGIKLFTNRLEKKLSGKGERRINIDPGYLTLANVFLATCKDYFHRTYLGRGIFLENEYRYVGKQFHPWEWTYPDYLKPEYVFFFHEIRKIYSAQIG